MNAPYPDSVVDKILQLTLKTQCFCYLAVDREGLLLNMGGDMASMTLPAWKVGENILDTALFLSGYLPLASAYECIDSVQLGEACVIDVHLFNDENCVWVILVDKTAAVEWEAIARQKTNELRLLQEEMARNEEKAISQELDTAGFEFFESLNMMALEENKDGSFRLLKPVPQIFRSIYPEAFEGSSGFYPHQEFPFVENFLIDASEVWGDPENSTRLRSGPWVETSQHDKEIVLEAIALNWKQRKLLFIEELGDNYNINRSFLQTGREGVLLKNTLEEEVRKQTREIRAREEEIALRLVCAADSRDDGETGSHIRRLGLYSELVARNLGWSEADAEEIRIAAPMHDIGKIGIPDYILKKPGKLTHAEFEIMKLHPKIGGRILSNSTSRLVNMASEICVGHHEKWDGNGYPAGLAGEDIPISARIVAIADVFDALVHRRVYKDEMPVDAAIELMLEGRGSHFDPTLLDLFIDLKSEMTEIAFDYSTPLNNEFGGAGQLLDDPNMFHPLR
jgi:HD-GYP domain-containing protein (c-di-GMP phosphodiesterase class II)